MGKKFWMKLACSFEQVPILLYFVKWSLLAIPVSAVVGSLVALFLWLLDMATHCRWQHGWLLFLLPAVGVAIAFLYRFKGKNSEAGNNLVMDEIHKPGGGIPAWMAPFIIITTVVTHLFGGSAGREGTAVQIGGSIAHFFAKVLRLNKADFRILLMTGISAGFGAVFGTPVAGTVFALEVLVVGKIKYDALYPCFITAVLSDIACTLCGIHHTHYSISALVERSDYYFNVNIGLLGWVLLAGIAFGLAGFFFAELSHRIKETAHRFIKNKYLIPLVGGVVIVALTHVVGTTDYLGLGVTTKTGEGTSIINAFGDGHVSPFGWFWKLLFTAITLSMGFKGGEVTPLFFIGATLGNTIGMVSGAPVDLMAGLGFIAVFAGATNTPLACTIMGVELFGGSFVLHYAIACFTAYYFSGHSGIYGSQRIGCSKGDFRHHLVGNNTLKSVREERRSHRGALKNALVGTIKKLLKHKDMSV